MIQVDWLDLVILILATFRLTHLIVFDQITSFLRKPFLEVTVIEHPDGQFEETVEIKGTGLRHFIGSILSCYWCSGIWVSAVTVLLYTFFPITYPLFLILAVAGAAAVIESKI
ncbi:DUF1360 domain-containing protein [Bacillus rubiinfantis]|uniref:DUF1360 domain-containing protein n=1 Tax=Bacillus rubiinfantis TaxID=1499680 RepID=UPI0005A899A2|nr:DUF1360 domain-containing protein [Bacillus rubiinfantis]